VKADFLKVPSDGLLLSLLVGWRTLFGWVVLETEVGSVVFSLIGWRQGGCFRLYIGVPEYQTLYHNPKIVIEYREMLPILRFMHTIYLID